MKPPLLGYFTPFTRLIFFLVLVLTGFLASFLVGLIIAIPIWGPGILNDLSMLSDFEDPRALAMLKYFQVIQSVGLFIVPALFAGFFYERNVTGYLKLDHPVKGVDFLLVTVLMFACLPALNWFITLNESMKLPEFMAGIESWMKNTEDQAGRLTEAFLNVNSVGGLLLNLFMIAVIPALGEEFLFRGVLQRILHEWLKNIHVAVILSAFLFAALHMQFYGIIPRFLLGVLFGYLLVWSGSLWLPILGHFINNASAVVIAWLAHNGWLSSGYEDFGNTDNNLYILLSFIITIALCSLLYRRKSTSWSP